MDSIIAWYAAVVSTIVGILHWNQWRRERVGAQLNVSPRVHSVKPDRFSHIEVDIQATVNPTTIRAVYLAAYKGWWHWLLRRDPAEVLGNDWSKIFPMVIEPGHGWEGLLAINDRERALAARYSHVRIMVRHTGYGRIASKPVTKMLRR
jgi:hypothetical protein